MHGMMTNTGFGMWSVCVLWLIYTTWEVAPEVTERVGCFNDSGPFILSGIIYRDKSYMTVDWCLNECLLQRGYVFAGLEAGYACLCGNGTDHTKYGPQLRDRECRRSQCPGNRSQTCGGPSRLDIYRDYNECSQHNGGCSMGCINTPLSYYCDCHNAPETEECSCRDGFDPVDGGEMLQCTDRDECGVDNGGCNQECVNSPGAYHCACRTGYGFLDGEKQNCTDVNECIDDPALCSMDHFECINTPGSYHCECTSGYIPKQGSCSDVNECTEDSDLCSMDHFECINTPGSYHCDCTSGYIMEHDNCSDVNECTEDPDICIMDNYECVNTPGSYRCECTSGYTLNQGSCSDIDECSLGEDKCNQNCNNTDGAYVCSCMTGYELVEKELYNCTDKDECADLNTCDQVCTNLPGGYECSCSDGYRPDDEQGGSCTDIDQCAEGSHQCDQICINTPGLYQCTCELGYHMEPDSYTCFECENGTYGMECKETCQCGGTYYCNASTGACFNTLQQTNGNGIVALSVGTLVPAILVTLGVLGAIVTYRRRKYKAKKTAGDESDNVIAATAANRSGANGNVDEFVIVESPHASEETCVGSTASRRRIEQHTLTNNTGHENSPSMLTTRPHKGQQSSTDTSEVYANVHTNFIPVAKLDSYADDTAGIEKEYKSVLSCYGIQSEAMGDNWRQKNKYKNIMPYENNRVKLTKNDLPYSDYINASYIHIPNSMDATIAAQGPIPETVPDFWRMVWEKNVLIIVMLTKEIENTKRKCAHYWPDSDLIQHDNLVIRPIGAAEFHDFVTRSFEIFQKADSTQRRTVYQFQFTSWPDKDVPENVAPLLRFYRKIQATSIPGTSTVVHCSAGVGRTGTFIALTWLLRQAKDEHGVDVLKCLHQLREQRMQMIQTLKQYMFLYIIVRDAIAIGDTTITRNDITGLYSNLQSTVSTDNYAILHRQYEILSGMPALTLKTAAVANQPQNEPYNRTDILPGDAGRVRLMSGASDYINAVKITGYNKSKYFIATQWPLDVTVEALWRMIHDYKIQAIVVLEDMSQSDSYPTFLPSKDNSLRVGDSRVHLVDEVTRVQTIGEMSVMISKQTHLPSDNIYSNVVESQAMGTNKMDHSVCVLTIPESHPLSVEQVVVLNERLAGLKLSSESTLVISRDGGELCGKFIAISILLQMLMEENEMDMFYVVQQIKSCRPEFFSDEASYLELHKLMQCYLEQQM